MSEAPGEPGVPSSLEAPVAPAEAPQAPATPAEARGASAEAPRLVVYLEDSPDNLRLVQWVLETTGRFTVVGAADGLAGLDLVRERRPALVLLDLDLPLLDGLGVARRLRADPDLRQIPIIAVSACVMRSERERSLDAGCMAFVEKPFDVLAFRETVEECLRRAAPTPLPLHSVCSEPG